MPELKRGGTVIERGSRFFLPSARVGRRTPFAGNVAPAVAVPFPAAFKPDELLPFTPAHFGEQAALADAGVGDDEAVERLRTHKSGGMLTVSAAPSFAARWLMPRLRPGSQGIAWVILTMFGFTAGSLIGSMLTMVGGDSLNSPAVALVISFVSYAVLGLMTGLLQWMALQYSARGALWWIGANAVGFGLGAILLSVIRVEAGNSPLAYGLAGLVVGATTAVAISRFRRPAGA